ncbi:hypothetical protein SBC1_20510 [Caballeronia sp. SBC1]|uniref:DUF3304 domain-containing protein n=1 Tax=unclassified Caballeronia TaxID=2646786 RepID=UPI0013E1AD6F|nr:MULTISPECIES: DUF3304 domain-containing protein [unclassified Caballeronia]QIE24158.1 hypothetical protein SBC2_21890 [Caballeronia sp. SBC2]QIN62054.1 hypothetical protein SBC1_20510 [Caballeronia sp. SBC1]
MIVKMAVRWSSIAVISLLIIGSLSGCEKDPYMLGIMGYNYTDRAIADFAVNGAAGSNVELSTPTGGGGKMSCCVVLARNTKAPFWIDVEYQMDALESYPPRKLIEPAGKYIKAKVQVKGPIPSDPSYLEVHFFPDQHIEVAISGQDGPSAPRLKLDRRLPFVR